MPSERQLKVRLLAAAALLALGVAAGYHAWWLAGQVSLWWLTAALAALELLRSLSMLTVRGRTPPPAARTPRIAAAHEGAAAPAANADAHEADAAAATWLQHAPIALFRIDLGRPSATPVALNASAHRILAHSRGGEREAVYDKLREQQVGQRTLVWFDGEHGAERALLTASALSADGGRQQLLAWMPVENELEAETLSAWRELTHVLTHEIMNSLTPVVSLSRSAQELLDAVQALLPEDINEDLAIAFTTIERRVSSLQHFVDSYRSLSAMPAPRPETVPLAQLFARLAALTGADWQARGGRAEFTVEPETLALEVDPGQFEQALINLLANAADATAGAPEPLLRVAARQGRGGRVQVDIWDNGPGVPDELAGQIFVPFFSTKERSSGVGLAVVRQLLHSNGGAVRYVKPVRGGAQFSISF